MCHLLVKNTNLLCGSENVNNKKIKIVTIILLLMIYLTSCSSEYNKSLKEYENLLDDIVIVLDSENVSNSIINNSLLNKFEILNEIFLDIENKVPDNKIHEFMLLRTKHEILEKIIIKGIEWDSLNNLDKFEIRDGISVFK